MAAPWPTTLGRYQGDSRTYPTLIIAFYRIQPEGHREPPNEVSSINSAELTTPQPTRVPSPISVRSRLRNTISETPTENKSYTRNKEVEE